MPTVPAPEPTTSVTSEFNTLLLVAAGCSVGLIYPGMVLEGVCPFDYLAIRLTRRRAIAIHIQHPEDATVAS